MKEEDNEMERDMDFRDFFSIVETRPHWYQLFIVPLYHTVGCGGDIENMKRGIVSHIKRFKNTEAVLYDIENNTQAQGIESPLTLIRNKEFINTKGHLLQDHVEEAVLKGYAELKTESFGFKAKVSLKKTIKKTGVKLVPKTTPLVVEEKKEVVATPNKVFKKTIKKPKVVIL